VLQVGKTINQGIHYNGMPAGTCERRCRKRKWIVIFQDASRFDQDPFFLGGSGFAN
jgi:hypothetical protein